MLFFLGTDAAVPFTSPFGLYVGFPALWKPLVLVQLAIEAETLACSSALTWPGRLGAAAPTSVFAGACRGCYRYHHNSYLILASNSTAQLTVAAIL